MPFIKAVILGLVGFLLVSTGYAETLVVSHYQHHHRYTYGAQLLDLALSKLDQPYRIESPNKIDMNEARGEHEVIAGNIDLQWLSTSVDREAQMIPVKVPIYRGILGLRLLLAKKERADEMSQISDLSQLQQYTGAHGKHWGDLPVYKANNLKVTTLVDYPKLFTLVKVGRADYFHRGLSEIWGEYERHSQSLAIADHVMLYYPHPVYFFVTRAKPQLARKIQVGLEKAEIDGSFKAHFLDYHQTFIDKANLASRKLIRLKNPNLPQGTPALDTSWWIESD